jgi:hypothetical protein
MPGALPIQLLFKRKFPGRSGVHSRHIASGTEPTLGARDNDAAYCRIDRKLFKRGNRLFDHVPGQRIESLGAIECEDGNAVFDIDKQVI